MAEEGLRERVASLCQDTYIAIDDNTAFATLEEQWTHLMEVVLGVSMAKGVSPLTIKLLHAKTLPRLLYIIANYTPPKHQGSDVVSFTVCHYVLTSFHCS